MNQIQKIIQKNLTYVSYQKKIKINDNFILSKDKNSLLKFIEITPSQYRFVFDTLNPEMKNLLHDINEYSKKNNNINIENLIWCSGGITITYDYKKNKHLRRDL